MTPSSLAKMPLWRIAVLLLLLWLALSSALPLPVRETGEHDPIETARQLWNDAKQLQRKLRPRRQTETYEPDLDLQQVEANLSAPQYFLDLYRNLSYHPNTQTDSNTILFIHTTKTSGCGEYNFTLESIHSQEYLLRAELRLYVKEVNAAYTDKAFVEVKRFRHGHDPLIVHTQLVSTNQLGWQSFDILAAVAEWKSDLEEHPHQKHGFKVTIYRSTSSRNSGGRPYNCAGDSPIKFATEDDDQEFQPHMLIYTYDPAKENIDYIALLENLRNVSATDPTSPATDAPNTQGGQKRSVEYFTDKQRKQRAVSPTTADTVPTPTRPQTPQCGKHVLTVTSSQLNEIGLLGDRTILHPSRFDAGICGGWCRSTFPYYPQHASLIHLLNNQRKLNNQGLQFTQCCAPVAYAPKDFLSRGPNGNLEITRLPKMTVSRCQCLEIVDYPSDSR